MYQVCIFVALQLSLLVILLPPFGIPRPIFSEERLFGTCVESLFWLSRSHSSPTGVLSAGNMLYCKLYNVRRGIGGTNSPDIRLKKTPGAK
jgi:hypothetical protein